jgi:hypothetical protein
VDSIFKHSCIRGAFVDGYFVKDNFHHSIRWAHYIRPQSKGFQVTNKNSERNRLPAGYDLQHFSPESGFQQARNP